VEVAVGPELVRFSVPQGRAAALAAALVEGVDEAGRAAGVAAASPPTDCAGVARGAALAWGLAGHPYGHRVEGRNSVLPTLRVGELQAFRQLRYVRDAAVLVAGPGAELGPMAEALPPALSRSVTPAVAVRPRGASIVLAAPVGARCEAWVLPTSAPWTAADEALLAVATRVVGDALPPARVDPVAVLSALPDDDALRAGFGWARAEVAADVARGDPAAVALLGVIRGASPPVSSELRAAVDGLTVEQFVAWGAALRAGSARVLVIPKEADPGAESPAGPRVPPAEELFR
jgi:hypothetical protein